MTEYLHACQIAPVDPGLDRFDGGVDDQYVNFLTSGYTSNLRFGGWICNNATSFRLKGGPLYMEQVLGMAGGNYGITSVNEMDNDNFEYWIDYYPTIGSASGLIFRGTYYDPSTQKRDADSADWYVQIDINDDTGGGGEDQIRVNIFKHIPGASGGHTATDYLNWPDTGQISAGIRLGITVSGDDLYIWMEPYGGGARTQFDAATYNPFDLTTDVGSYGSDSYNDADHKYVGIWHASNPDIGTKWETVFFQSSVGATASAGSELWFLSLDTYGRQTDASFAKAPDGGLGNDSPLYLRTEPYAPEGPSGTTLLRRIYAIIGYQFGGCTVRVTPVVDFKIRMPGRVFVIPEPVSYGYQKAELELEAARKCTWVEAIVEVLTRSGRVEILGVHMADRPVSQAASSVVGVE